jgi:hypothetical protein
LIVVIVCCIKDPYISCVQRLSGSLEAVIDLVGSSQPTRTLKFINVHSNNFIDCVHLLRQQALETFPWCSYWHIWLEREFVEHADLVHAETEVACLI